MKINFKQFIKYKNDIQENQDEDFVVDEMMRVFFPKRKDVNNCIVEFQKAIEEPKPIKLPFWYKIDIGLKNAGKFIDADIFLTENSLIDFVDTIVKHRIPFYKVNLTINHVRHLTDFFLNARRK